MPTPTPPIPEELEDNVLRQLNLEEGRRRAAYQDQFGYWTIGVGRLIDARKGGGLSNDEINYLLGNDVIKVWAALLFKWPWILTISAPRQAVLLQMAFQMGIDGLAQFNVTLGLIQSQQFEAAAAAMLQSTWAKQTPERATRLADQMQHNAWVFKPS